VRWIEEYDGEAPFAMMVGFPGPHNPYDPPAEYATFQSEDMPEPLAAVPSDTGLMVKHSEPVKGAPRKAWYAIDNEAKPGRVDFLRMRAYYCGLVKLIDDQVGAIVEALRNKGELENTVIIFGSDHGDYLGDHGLTGKGSFYEGSCHVPLIARVPGSGNGRVADDLVTLTDVTATILSQAGCDVPPYMDSQPLPGLGSASESAPREQISGVLVSEWMLFDSRWKLCKYRGGSHLYDLGEDPGEQCNRIADPACVEVRQRLDTALTAQIMTSLDQTFFPNRVYYGHSYSPSVEFGQPGWERVYPKTWEQAYTETDW
jgi:arylsulfatase